MRTKHLVLIISTALAVAHCKRGKGESTAATVEANVLTPDRIDENKAIAVGDLKRAYFAWQGKKLTVSGNYHSTTISTTSYGKTIRVDLTDAQGNKAVGADSTVDPSDKLVNNRENVQMKCTIKGTVFDTVNLTDCQLLNR